MASKWKFVNQAALAHREALHAELKAASKLNKADSQIRYRQKAAQKNERGD